MLRNAAPHLYYRHTHAHTHSPAWCPVMERGACWEKDAFTGSEKSGRSPRPRALSFPAEGHQQGGAVGTSSTCRKQEIYPKPNTAGRKREIKK